MKKALRNTLLLALLAAVPVGAAPLLKAALANGPAPAAKAETAKAAPAPHAAVSSRDVAASGRPAFTGADGTAVQEAAPIPKDTTDDRRKQRNYPDQPPVIPHSVAGYQLDLNVNKCLTCHSRQFTGDSQAPMVSVTHFQDRDGQTLGAVSARRYFCLQCHVPQSEVEPRVTNTFEDIDALIAKAKPGAKGAVK